MEAGSTLSSSRSDRARSASSSRCSRANVRRLRTASPSSSIASHSDTTRPAAEHNQHGCLIHKGPEDDRPADDHAATSRAQRRCPAAPAVYRATASGTAAEMPT